MTTYSDPFYYKSFSTKFYIKVKDWFDGGAQATADADYKLKIVKKVALGVSGKFNKEHDIKFKIRACRNSKLRLKNL